MDQCRERTEVFIKALEKLNALPLQAGRVRKLERPSVEAVDAAAAGVAREHAVLEVTVYFSTGEAYPTDEGLDAMSELVRRINASGGAVKVVTVVGSVDVAEAEVGFARGLARGRAEIVHRYFLMAGVEKARMQAAIKVKPANASVVPADRFAHAVVIVELPLSGTQVR